KTEFQLLVLWRRRELRYEAGPYVWKLCWNLTHSKSLRRNLGRLQRIDHSLDGQVLGRPVRVEQPVHFVDGPRPLLPCEQNQSPEDAKQGPAPEATDRSR